MPNISIKGVPDQWAEALRQRAARNHRSLQGELMAIIELAANEAAPGIGVQPAAMAATAALIGTVPRFEPLRNHDRLDKPGIRRGWKTIEQIAAEHIALFPEPFKGGPLSVDIIREDRDSR